MTTSDGDSGHLDDQMVGLLAQLRDLYTAIDPMPAHLVAHAQFAVELDAIELELARPGTHLQLAGATSRGVEEARHMTFDGGGLEIIIAVNPSDDGTHQVDGWLTPAAVHRVDLRIPGDVLTTRSDERGRFVIDAVRPGPVQLIVHVGDVAVTSPTIALWRRSG